MVEGKHTVKEVVCNSKGKAKRTKFREGRPEREGKPCMGPKRAKLGLCSETVQAAKITDAKIQKRNIVRGSYNGFHEI